MQRLRMTLVTIYDDEKILLGMKKRGFGVGKWNGFGGKVKDGEDLFSAAQRELLEECGVQLQTNDALKKRGVIDFIFEDKPDEVLEVNFFSIHADMIVGEPLETEEMKPQWFAHDDIPYASMWVDDPHWLPLLLDGKNFVGTFLFSANGDQILEKKLQTLENI